MAGDNKILTVSYGTFSCTVEGFDDPLGTMREITEYFRDLSAEDRYFGAEPLTPEPERLPMLADRRATTHAKPGSGAVHAALGQAKVGIDDADEMAGEDEAPTAPEPAATAAPAETPADVPPPQPEVAAAPPTEEPVGTAAEAHVDTPPEPPAVQPEPRMPAPAAGSATERLARIRAAAGPDLGETPASGEEEDEDAIAPDMPAGKPSAEDAHAGAEADISAAIARNAVPQPAAEAPAYAEDGDRQGHGASAFEDSPIDAGGGTADRIFREAGHALEDIEARRRHSAIAHLKAAVSATVNDRNILGWRKRQNEEEEVAYRADLAQAVKPDHRTLDPVVPVLPETAGEMDEDDDFGGVETSKPLVLGMEARVDPNSLAALALTEEDRVLEEDTRPLRPRASDETFSEFAERMGARGLSDLLEAAAAYSGQIEGRPQFSRPQIMKHVVAVTDDEYSREDGLRSFGALLRQGKIEKLKRGVFALTGNSRFAARPRLAGE